MSKLIGHLVERNGKIAVCYTSTLYGEPVELRRYYLSDVRVTDDTREFVGRLVSSGRYDGNRWHIADSTLWLDVNGEVETEESPIPRPRTRQQTRWNDLEGCWQKLTRKGWEFAR